MERDNQIFDLIKLEHQRQLKGVELIASEKLKIRLIIHLNYVANVIKKSEKYATSTFNFSIIFL